MGRTAASIGGAVLVAAGAALAWATWGRGGRDIRVGAMLATLPTPDYVAADATIEIRRDQRSSGLILKHEVLKMTKVSRPTGIRLRGDTLIYTDIAELEHRIDDALDGRVPVLNGLEATFAIGRLAPAKIVRLDTNGRVTSVEDVRATFVAFTLEQ